MAEPIILLALIESGLGVGLIRSSAHNHAPRSLRFEALPWGDNRWPMHSDPSSCANVTEAQFAAEAALSPECAESTNRHISDGSFNCEALPYSDRNSFVCESGLNMNDAPLGYFLDRIHQPVNKKGHNRIR